MQPNKIEPTQNFRVIKIQYIQNSVYRRFDLKNSIFSVQQM